jgi:hypothetical protein
LRCSLLGEMMPDMERVQLLLVPTLTEMEWVIKPHLEEWAEVASYDAPGIGAEPAVDDFGATAVARRGLAEVERRGWDSFVLVADEFGLPAASHIAAAAQPRLQALVLGHARLSNSTDGPRPAINIEVLNAIRTLMRTDPRSFVRQMFKMTAGEGLVGGYGDDMVDEYIRRVPLELGIPLYDTVAVDAEGLAERLTDLDVPVLLAQHKGCLMFTDEGFEDAVAAFPDATVVRCIDKPSTSEEFVGELREFCATLTAVRP